MRVARFVQKSKRFRVYEIEDQGAEITNIVVDPMGLIWFADQGKDRIGRVGEAGP